MIGSSGTLVDRKGSYVIPKIEKTTTTKTYKMRLPYGAVILANNVTIISGADNLTYNGVTYTVKSQYADIIFSVPITEPVTIYTYKSISYVDYVQEQSTLTTPISITSSDVGFVNYKGEMYTVYQKGLYKWNGFGWKLISQSPVSLGLSVVYNNEIHSFANSDHYKWNGNEWTKVSTLPYNLGRGACVAMHNGEIHIAGGYQQRSHYKWDGGKWISVSSLPISFARGGMVSYKNNLHIFGGNNSSYGHYKWDGSAWIQDVDLPGYFYDGCCTVYNDCIYILGGTSTLAKSCRYFDGTSWKTGPQMKVASTPGCCLVYNNELHVMYTTNHYKYSIDTNIWDNTQKSKVFQTIKNIRLNNYVASSIDKQYIADIENTSTLIEF